MEVKFTHNKNPYAYDLSGERWVELEHSAKAVQVRLKDAKLEFRFYRHNSINPWSDPMPYADARSVGEFPANHGRVLKAAVDHELSIQKRRTT